MRNGPLAIQRAADGSHASATLAALPASDLGAVLEATNLDAIGGIGRRIPAQLQAEGLKTALDVARMDPATVRRRWSIVLERTVRELQEQACVPLEEVSASKREIAYPRSFGSPVKELVDLVEAVSKFAGRAAEKLRNRPATPDRFWSSSTPRLSARRQAVLPLDHGPVAAPNVRHSIDCRYRDQRSQADLQAWLPLGKGRRDAAALAGQFG